MGPAGNATSSIKLSTSSPLPYLFGSLALVLVMIAVALVMLACSYRKRSPNSSADEEAQQKQEIAVNVVVHSEPKIVVIMAGDDKPTFLAKPVAPSFTCSCEQV